MCYYYDIFVKSKKEKNLSAYKRYHLHGYYSTFYGHEIFSLFKFWNKFSKNAKEKPTTSTSPHKLGEKTFFCNLYDR